MAPDEVVTRAVEVADTSASGPRVSRGDQAVGLLRRVDVFAGGPHVERTEFLGTDQSPEGQQLMLQYLATPNPPASCPCITVDIYDRALESGRVPGLGSTNAGVTPVMSTAQSFTRHDVSFTSGKDACAAWLYLPAGVTSPPVVILGHGLGATREMRWTPSLSGSHRPASPRWPSPTGTSVTARPTPPAAVDQASTGRLGCRHRIGEGSAQRRRHPDRGLGQLLSVAGTPSRSPHVIPN